ncbi:MAG: tyrosine-type recombinase/integrase [Moraxella sp.]|nr:tyrosine-type recombinase/integrase [Moraxella sp.]
MPATLKKRSTPTDELKHATKLEQGQAVAVGGLPEAMLDWIDVWQDGLYLSGYAMHSMIAYRTAVCELGEFVVLKGVRTWQAVDRPLIKQYMATRLDADGLHLNSAKLKLSAIRQFFSFLEEKGQLPKNPVTGYRLTGKTDRLPVLLDADVLNRLLEHRVFEEKDQPLWLRDRAMFELLYGSGLRVSELVGLDVADAAGEFVRVLGKGSKERHVPIGKKSVAALAEYLPIRAAWLAEKNSTVTALFISQKTAKRLGVRSVQSRLVMAARRAGIEEHLHPHLLRHAFASHILSSSHDLRGVQEMLGHSDMKSTQVYTHLDFAALARLYDSTHPRA